MSLLEIRDICHSYGEKLLYKDSSFELYKGEHMGLVGQNGAGKSTLMKTLMGKILPDKGLIKWQSKIKISYLDQYAEMDEEQSIFDYLRTAYKDLYDTEAEINELYMQMAEDCTDALLNKVAKLQEILDQNDFYSLDSEIQKVAAGLGVTSLGLERPIKQLSGGQRAKVILSKVLLDKPDVILLDEPTNFLDVEHVEWLATYLQNFEGSYIVISHDFEFLDKITTCICDIEFGKISKYSGSYNAFMGQKAMRREQYIKEYESQQRIIAKEEEFIARNKARAATAGMAQGRQKKLDKMDKIEPPKEMAKPVFHFKSLPMNYSRIVDVKDLEVGYYFPLLPKLNFSIETEKKVIITGFNGIGKSTLLKTIMGIIPSLGGKHILANTTKICYYEQDLVWDSNELTPFEIMTRAYPKMHQKDVRGELARCAIKAEHVAQPIGTLSGGEQAKVKICLLLQKECNLLILDEPTNHLDLDAKAALQDAIKEYKGTVIVVSHEPSFYRDWADRVIDIEKIAKK